MVNESTYERMALLGLTAMVLAWKDQQKNAEYMSMPFDDRFGLLVETEWVARENKRLKRRLAEARLKISNASVDAIDYPAVRKLDKATIRQLATCAWIAE